MIVFLYFKQKLISEVRCSENSEDALFKIDGNTTKFHVFLKYANAIVYGKHALDK
jgi:hypothetical protein